MQPVLHKTFNSLLCQHMHSYFSWICFALFLTMATDGIVGWSTRTNMILTTSGEIVVRCIEYIHFPR